MYKLEKKLKNSENLIILLCWLVYTCAYLGRYSYSSNTINVIAHYGITKADAGLVGTVFFITYGIGQILNGICCKRYNVKNVITIAVLLSAIVNFILFFDVPFFLIKYLWFFNGVAQSVLWPTLILTLSRNLKKEKLKTAVIVMSTTVAIGTVTSYVLSALFIQVLNFKYSFLTAFAILIVVGLVWFFAYDKVAVKGEVVEEEKPKQQNPKSELSVYVVIMLAFLAIFAIVNNLVKDGLNTWVPNVLKETFGLKDSVVLLLTTSLSVLGVFGSFFAVFLNKIFKNFVALSGIMFFLSALCITLVIVIMKTDLWYVLIVIFGITSLLMHGINNVVTSMSPLYLRGKINSGLLSGLMNGACYVGSAISSYGLGYFADGFGWSAVFNLMLIVCVVSVVLSLIFLLYKKFIYKQEI